jgi:Cof subfamily protein (haloacid dehalogenase superfamily)
VIKLVAADMDGTLLNDESQITEKNALIIKEIQRLGIEFIINSGRNFYDIKHILEEADINCNCICMNGAASYDFNGTILSEIPLAKATVMEILKIFKDYHLADNIQTNKGIYTTLSQEEMRSNFFDCVIPAFQKSGKTTENFELRIPRILSSITYVNQLEELMTPDLVIYKVSASSPDTGRLSAAKKVLTAFNELAVSSSFSTNIEITDHLAEKGSALFAYAKARHISLSEIMALGDSENDYSMLSMDLGYPVAMSNADDLIKKTAKYLTKSNEEDGVAYAIEKFILNKGISPS